MNRPILDARPERFECGCKGIRKCLLCENWKTVTSNHSSSENNYDNKEQTLYYCSVCKHLFNTPELANFINIDKVHDFCHQNCASSFFIDGITVINNFLSEEEEKHFLQQIEKHKWVVSQSGRYKQDFGPKVNFKKKKVKAAAFEGFPLWVESLVDKLKRVSQLDNFKPVELCNLEYTPDRGSCIDPHIDDSWLWGERLVTINLESDTFLTLSSPKTFSDNRKILIPMPRYSLLILQGNSRHIWLHSISRQHIKSRRIAMTFRELSNEFLPQGAHEEIGRELLLKAQLYFS